jgi:hypothetical protein
MFVNIKAIKYTYFLGIDLRNVKLTIHQVCQGKNVGAIHPFPHTSLWRDA